MKKIIINANGCVALHERIANRIFEAIQNIQNNGAPIISGIPISISNDGGPSIRVKGPPSWALSVAERIKPLGVGRVIPFYVL